MFFFVFKMIWTIYIYILKIKYDSNIHHTHFDKIISELYRGERLKHMLKLFVTLITILRLKHYEWTTHGLNTCKTILLYGSTQWVFPSNVKSCLLHIPERWVFLDTNAWCLHHCVVIFVWSSGIIECTCMLFTFENGVPLMH